MNIEPLNDKVVVKPLSSEEVRESGFVVAGSEDSKQNKGEVVAVGPGKMLESGQRAAMTVKVGDTILFAEGRAQEVSVAGENYAVIDEPDIVGVLQG